MFRFRVWGLVYLRGGLVGGEKRKRLRRCTAHELDLMVVEDVDESDEAANLREAFEIERWNLVEDNGVEGAGDGCVSHADVTQPFSTIHC